MRTNFLLSIKNSSRQTICWAALSLFLLEWFLLAFNVHSRKDWLLENILVFILIGPVIFSYLKGHISTLSYVLLLLFLSLHTIGAHYTYSLVPYEELGQQIFNGSINNFLHWERNNFDRVIHFMWGFLLFVPLCDWIRSITSISGKTLIVFSISIIVTTSTFYELIEWAAAVTFGGDLGVMYVGAQGDIWDAQKDQALAFLGGLISWMVFNAKAVSKN